MKTKRALLSAVISACFLLQGSAFALDEPQTQTKPLVLNQLGGLSDLCLNIGPLSAEQISPATAPVRMLNALREGWLLEENTEERQDIPCVRLALEQTGSGGDIVTTIWLRQTDGTPVFGEIAVEGETILTAEFTSFSFCDIINETGTEQAGLPREST